MSIKSVEKGCVTAQEKKGNKSKKEIEKKCLKLIKQNNLVINKIILSVRMEHFISV